jgi:hypothetical protein
MVKLYEKNMSTQLFVDLVINACNFLNNELPGISLPLQ